MSKGHEFLQELLISGVFKGTAKAFNHVCLNSGSPACLGLGLDLLEVPQIATSCFIFHSTCVSSLTDTPQNLQYGSCLSDSDACGPFTLHLFYSVAQMSRAHHFTSSESMFLVAQDKHNN